MKEATIILPNQLYTGHPALKKNRKVFLVEHPRYFSDFSFHVQKLILHRASMRSYYKKLKELGYDVSYLAHEKKDTLLTIAKRYNCSTIFCTEIFDSSLQKELQQLRKEGISVTEYKSPNFFLSKQEFQHAFSGRKQVRMFHFYESQRKQFGILLNKDGKPKGGKWSFDEENRKSLPKEVRIPVLPQVNEDKEVGLAKRYVQEHFPNAPGKSQRFFYPTHRKQALLLLQTFFKEKFSFFGTYQDAIESNKPFLFHSLISSSINIGLLSPQEVVDKAVQYAEKEQVPINALEGFIRQILGWREYVMGVYLVQGEEMRMANHFEHTKQIPKAFYLGKTGLQPADDTIKKVHEYAYAHHIERLMIVGNLFVLCEIDPKEVHKWFMELFIDAYDWVMVPNVFGMSQYADGGNIVTKPYISSSNYLRKMSHYKKGAWSDIWDALYWRFIYKHKDELRKNYRYAYVLKNLESMPKQKLQEHLKRANTYLESL